MTVDREVLPGGELFLDVDDPATRMTITVTSTAGRVERRESVGISEVQVPGVQVATALVVDGGLPERGWVLTAQQGSLDRCGPAPALPTATVCSASLASPGPDPGTMRRVVVSPSAVRTGGTAWVRPAATAQAAELVDRLATPAVRLTATSTLVPDLAVRPQAASDDDPSTAWRAAVTDLLPALTAAWDEPAAVTGVRLVGPDDGLSGRPTQVRVEVGDQAVTAEVPADGLVPVPATTATGLTVTVLESTGPTSVDLATAGLLRVPVAVAELEVVGGPAASPAPRARTDLGCGSGPSLLVAGGTVATRVSPTVEELLSGGLVPASACTPVRLAAGETEVEVPGSFLWAVRSLVLRRDDAPDPATGSADALLDRPLGVGSRTVLPTGTNAVLLASTVPAGTGWRAAADGEVLEPVVLDGWRQGWQLPLGTREVRLDYPPGAALRTWTGVGLLGWLVLVVLAAGSAAAGSLGGRRRARHGGAPPRDQSLSGRSR